MSFFRSIRLLINKALQILLIGGHRIFPRQRAELAGGNELLLIGDLFRAADQQPLAMLDGPHKLRRLQQRVMRASVELGIAAAKLHHPEFAQLQRAPVDVGDLDIAAHRRL